MKPIEAKTFDDVANNLVEDNTATPHFWMAIDGTSITLVEQITGESASATLKIPKKISINLWSGIRTISHLANPNTYQNR